MSSNLDKILMNLRIDEVEEPFKLPDLPEYCSSEENRLSLVGRLLNPDCQNISDLVLDMPQKWQLYDKVRGVALSREWLEKPPVGYLQFIPVWVQMRNIPINHKTVKSIMALGEFAGQVIELAYDPS